MIIEVPIWYFMILCAIGGYLLGRFHAIDKEFNRIIDRINKRIRI